MLEYNPALFLYQLGIFLVFAVCVAVIYKTLLAPVMRERRERIEGDMARAAAARAEADVAKRKYEERMAQVGQEATAILKRVNDEAARHREELLAQARHQTDSLLAQAEKLIAFEEAEAIRRVRAQLADMAVDIARRVLEETRSTEREHALARRFLADLEKRGPFDRGVDA